MFTTKADLFHNHEQKKPIMSQYKKSTIHNEYKLEEDNVSLY